MTEAYAPPAMGDTRVRPEPTGFVTFQAGMARVLARSGYEGALRVLAERGIEAFPGPVRRFRGRGEPVSVPIPGHPGERMVVRRYRRGGLVGRLVSDIYLGAARAKREVSVSEMACQEGAPVAQPLGTVASPAGAGLFRLDMVTREVEGAVDLSDALAWPAALRRRAARAAGRAVRLLHDAGVLHADLNVKNILVREGKGGVEAFVIDLDRARVGVRGQRSNLLRLLRSAVKVSGSVPTGAALAFLLGYCGDRASARKEARAIGRRFWEVRLHRLLWGRGW